MALPQFHVYASNRMEFLAEHWLALAEQPLSHPFSTEVVIVQNQGMARWLTLRLAERKGVAMNLEFPFLRRFICDLLKNVFPEEEVSEELQKISRETFLWSLYRYLPEFVREDSERFSELGQYLADGSMEKRFQMAEQLANVFDRYIIHRSDILQRWTKQTDGTWLSLLWQRLWQQLGSPRLFDEWKALLYEKIGRTESSIPERISVLGISSMPPLFLDFLKIISERIPVHLFFLNPVGEESFWGDLQSKRQHARKLLKNNDASDDSDLYSENPLLASLGKQGQDFFNLLLDSDNKWEENFFVKPDEKTVLSQLQSDLFYIRNRAGDERWADAEKEDDSIQIHSCHNPIREVEVLYDRLLCFFDKDKSLRPEDVIVMLPDIDQYAPYIHAVFSSPEQDKMRIPYSLSDRKFVHESNVAETFFALFELSSSRMNRSEVLEFIFRETVREKFKIKTEDFEKINAFIECAGIRWGIDKNHRHELGLAAFDENSWLWGFRRLLFGYAMKGESGNAYDDVLPVEGLAIDGDLLGYLIASIETLFAAIKDLHVPKTLSQWHNTLMRILQDCFSENKRNTGEFRKLRGLFSELKHFFDVSGDTLIDAKSIFKYFKHGIEDEDNSNAFMRNGITFCSMRPMRSVPAKVVCLLGLNYDTFPRSNPVLSFDVLQKQARIGDRSQRQNDQYLFLECILSAREKLYLSYTGRSEKDNTLLPPSVLLTDLEDYLTVAWQNGKSRYWFYDEKLQAFHADYFTEETRLLSYSEDNAVACKTLLSEESQTYNFFDITVPVDEEEPESEKNLTLDALVSFFQNPTKAFLQKRLNMRLPEKTISDSDNEPFEPSGLENYLGEKSLIEARFKDGGIVSDENMRLQLGHRLAPGYAGDFFIEEIQKKTSVLEQSIFAVLNDDRIEIFAAEKEIGGSMISGTIPYAGDKVFFWFPSKMKAKHLLKVWIYGLFAAACAKKHELSFSHVYAVFQDKTECLALPENVDVVLEMYVGLYRKGMSKLLPFFPEASHEYVKILFKDETQERIARQMAEKKFLAGREYGGEFCDAYVRFVYRNGFDFLRDDFKTTAINIYQSILQK